MPIFNHILIKTVDLKSGDKKIYATNIYCLIKELPENGIDEETAKKLIIEKYNLNEENIKKIYLLYYYNFYHNNNTSLNFPNNGWWWVIETEERYGYKNKYFVNYETGEIISLK